MLQKNHFRKSENVAEIWTSQLCRRVGTLLISTKAAIQLRKMALIRTRPELREFGAAVSRPLHCDGKQKKMPS
jgi:hypothetical protein